MRLTDETGTPFEETPDVESMYIERGDEVSRKDVQEFVPVSKTHTNRKYTASGCGDLPVTYADNRLFSVWKMPSFWQRVRFLFNGEVTLILLGSSQPPCCIVRGDSVERLGDK